MANIKDWGQLLKAGGGILNALANRNSESETGAFAAPTVSPEVAQQIYDNEVAYLTGLSKNGNDGEKAWANNQLSILNGGTATTSTPTTSTPTTSTYTPTGTYNDADLPVEAKAQIQACQQAYAEAMAKGDTAAAEKAHTDAEAIRAMYGYSGGADGSEKIDIGNVGGDISLWNFAYDAANPNWNDNYDAANPKPTYEESTIDGKGLSQIQLDQLAEILNRDDFSYNVENDPLYAQYKTMYNREGDRAMRDTLAEAAASAGGMNSYAITAAQQANNYYASQLNDKIPELYQLAYEMYLQDKESMVEDLGLISQMSDTEYNRYKDTINEWWNDKSFAYGVFTDEITQGNWEKDFDNKNESSDQATARDDVWKLISIGVTPSADLIAKAGMSKTDVDLAVAAVTAGGAVGTGDTGNNGYTGNTGDTGDTGFTDDAPATTGVSDEIKNKCASFTSNTELGNYIDGLVATGTISSEDGDKLYAQYVDDNEKFIANEDGSSSDTHSYGEMIKSTKGWEVVDDGGVNWFWGVDNNAILKAPNGEQIRLDNLLDKLVSEGMDKKAAKDAIKALQKNLKI